MFDSNCSFKTKTVSSPFIYRFMDDPPHMTMIVNTNIEIIHTCMLNIHMVLCVNLIHQLTLRLFFYKQNLILG